MKSNLVVLPFLFVTITSFTSLKFDIDPFTDFLKRMELYLHKNPIEKVHLHLDKPYYAAGDNIWFKAYLTDQNNFPSVLSSELYVELIDAKDKLIKQIKLPIFSGLAWADFQLTNDLEAGNYRIRAYTQWMRNAGPSYFFDKTVIVGRFSRNFILDEKKKQERKHNNSINGNKINPKYEIQFFPESGNLIAGINSKIGIKCIAPNGFGVDAQGTITDNENNEVARFATTHLGMGNFILNPQPGKSYSATIIFNDGTSQEKELPAPLLTGYALSVDNSDTAQIKINVKCKGTVGRGELKLLLQHNGITDTVVNINNKNESNEILLSKKQLESGIFRLTLFDLANQPVCERLFFNRNIVKEISLSLDGLKTTYNKQEKIDFNVLAKLEYAPVRGSFSISVTNASTIVPDPEHESNILTALLLTTDLNGYIEDPNIYLDVNSNQVREQLDNLMLIQGWSRYTWKAIAEYNINDKADFSPETSQQIKGAVTTLGNSPIANAKVSLLSTNNGYFSTTTTTDIKGHFDFSKLSFADGTTFVIHAFNPKSKNNVDLHIDSIPAQVIPERQIASDPEDAVNETVQMFVKKSESYFQQFAKRGLLERGINLKDVNIAAQKTRSKNSSNLNGPGNADFIFAANDLKYTNSILIALENLMAGVTIKNFSPYLINGNGGGMLIVVDGLKANPEILTYIDMQEIQSIEVLRNKNLTAMYGFEGENGVLVITTLTGRGVFGKKMNGVTTIAPKGYYRTRSFYSPQYTVKNNENLADQRSTVYWRPDLITNGDGIATVEFYSANEPGTYRIVIEGIDNKGHLARTVRTCEVK